ncbi:MAG TPA: metallophosphoesterase [Solirubrobacteraceae bacterium]|nr:metallophosphoesterase [Solirubrobacteraceae bacterium]
MRTLVISDLHLGSAFGADVLRSPAVRARLLDELAAVDRLVLLGDVVELRHGPPRDAMAIAEPFFREVGEAMAGGTVVLVPGNHDHALIEPWLAARGELGAPASLAVEQLLEPGEASAAYARIARWLAAPEVTVAYPGLHLREDVYATHGHYLDVHLTVPTLERLGMSVMTRVNGRPAATLAGVDDYEATAAPVYAWRDSVARVAPTSPVLNGAATANAWRTLAGGGNGVERIRRQAARAAFPLAVAALNRAGLGPLSPALGGDDLRVAGLNAMAEVARRLSLAGRHVVFGHTHRPGPLPDDALIEWLGGGDVSLVNAGSWCYSAVFLTTRPGESPYWPGSAVLIEDEAAPVVRRLLQDVGHEQLDRGAP